MNEQLKQRIEVLRKNIDSRRQAEKLLIFGMVLAGVVLTYLTIAFDPIRADLEALRGQIANTQRQITAQQTAYQNMVAQSQEDPNRFANERLAVIEREQAVLTEQIQALAGDLVTPNQMTQILTTVLERQSGLELISFRNVEAEPLREGATNTAQLLAEAGAVSLNNVAESEVVGQVYAHGLIIEFQGDYFSTLKYLRFLEEITGSFFWDEVAFRQLEWPNAHVTLQIHTLSTDQGFIGV